MRDLDEPRHPLADAAAVQAGHTVFGDDVVDVAAAGADAAAGFEPGDDARAAVLVGGGGERDDRTAVLAAARAADEVLQGADAAVKPVAARIAHHLACQIDFARAIDRHHPLVARDLPRVVDHVAGMQLDLLVIIHEAVELAGAHHMTGDDFSRMVFFQ